MDIDEATANNENLLVGIRATTDQRAHTLENTSNTIDALINEKKAKELQTNTQLALRKQELLFKVNLVKL